jgi:hypothetical protein
LRGGGIEASNCYDGSVKYLRVLFLPGQPTSFARQIIVFSPGTCSPETVKNIARRYGEPVEKPDGSGTWFAGYQVRYTCIRVLHEHEMIFFYSRGEAERIRGERAAARKKPQF